MRTRRCLVFLSLIACRQVTPAEPPAAATAAAPAGLGRIEARWRSSLRIDTVAAFEGELSLQTTGKIAFDDDHTQHVTAPVDGRVAAIKVRLGENVRIGQPLVELTSAKVAELQGDARKEAQDLQVAQRGLARAQKLRADGAVSDKELAQARADLNKAQANVERAQAQLSALGVQKSDPMVRAALFARVDGTVVERNISVGQEVRADSGTPLLTLTNLDRVWVLADVYEQDLGTVGHDAAVQVEVSAYTGRQFAGTVTYVGDVVDSQSRTVKVRCQIDNPNRLLKPEMFAKVQIAYRSPPGSIFVPTKALLSDGNSTQVLVVEGSDDNVTLRPVQTGTTVAGRQQITSGLRVGERLVVDGAVFLRNALGD